ncbi:hypothetical protein ACFSQ3_15590 [Sphingobacterium corticis]|uniref:Prenyltransferase n=1 Tax=Sphingobacterium corticis TaxID=1812823 RepID=A0ABW5NQ40_9SPHI
MASVAQSALTYLILNIPSNPLILLIEGCSTMALYNMSLFYSKPADPLNAPFARTRWFFRYQTAMIVLTALALSLLLYSVFHLGFYSMLYLGFVGIASMLYNLPFLRLGKSKGGLRQIPGLKLFHIAIVWSLSTVGLPIVDAWEHGLPIDWHAANFLGAIKVLFLLICTLPFDVRDFRQDSYYNLKTIPTMIGTQRSIRLNYLMIGMHSLLIAFAPYGLAIKVGLWISNIFIVCVLRKFIFLPQQNHYHAAYLLDLALVAQFVAVLMMIYIMC